jgi:UDP-2-acetamido-3-amino-2,3-dideoxy-glucuronate N-acetyltransferase
MTSTGQAAHDLEVVGCSLFVLPESTDARGSLAVASLGTVLTEVPRRVFMIYEVPADAQRGGHANRSVTEVIMAVSGSVEILIDNGVDQRSVTLDHPSIALRIPPMVWAVQRAFQPGTALVVVASGEYDRDEYITDYATFQKIVNADA